MSSIRRRDVILGVGGTLALPRAARAQQKAIPVIGFLAAAPPGRLATVLAAFHQGLGETAFIEGRNVAVEYRWAEDHYDRLPALAADLVNLGMNVIVAATLPAALAAKAATATIPIVFFSGGDPVDQGLVASFSRPGGNLTGASVFINDLGPKRLELLREVAPKAAIVGYLANPENPNYQGQLAGMRDAAGATGWRLIVLDARNLPDIDAAVVRLAEQDGAGLIVGADPLVGGNEPRIAALAVRHRLPAIAGGRGFVDAGGLIAYGNDIADAYRQVGLYTGRVLQGAKPADLPVVRANKFQLFVNLKTAETLGLAMPQAILARADEVIE